MAKVTIVGAGFVGRTAAMRIAQRGLADVCLIDIIEGWPQGIALDLKHSAPVERFEVEIVGTNDYKDTADSDVTVITAGLPRQPGMSRMDLLGKNAEIIRDVAEQVAEHSPNTIIITVTNPLDEMTFLAAEVSGLPRQKVIGMAGVLDSARLAHYIAEELKVPALSVDAMTLGSHGEQMVPLPRHATVDGRPLTELADEETLKKLYARTANAGAEVVELLQKGSAFYAPSASVAKMVNAVLADTKEVMPVCAWVTGQYGINDVFVGVPGRLGRGGVEEIVEIDLNDDELQQLTTAADAIKAKCAELEKLS
jgi:malate dehydrogenase